MMRRRPLLLGMLATPFVIGQARAADPLRVAIFEAGSTLPYFVALTRGFFTDVGIAPQGFVLANHPLIVQALVAGEVDACTNLVTLEGANINARRANTVTYFALNGQNAEFRMEQFVLRANSTVTTLAGLRGARIMSAPARRTWPPRAAFSPPPACRTGETTPWLNSPWACISAPCSPASSTRPIRSNPWPPSASARGR